MDKFGVLEKQFDYKGHDCICIFNCLGYRCGYVSVDDYKDCYEYDIDCHCGLSFGASRLPEYYNPKKDYYIGFDCGHICDLKIYDKPKELSEFYKPCSQSKNLDCDWLRNHNVCSCSEKKSITRPPQSWQYIEDLREE